MATYSFPKPDEVSVPCVHLNGTGRQSLLDQFSDAATAVNKAMRTLCEAAPNGRDYYPLGPDALEKATQEHLSRVSRLQTVVDEYQEIVEQIYKD